MTYAIVDAEGAFDSAGVNKSYVHASFHEKNEAIKAAKRMRQVQIIQGADLHKGEIVYGDAIGRVYPRVAY